MQFQTSVANLPQIKIVCFPYMLDTIIFITIVLYAQDVSHFLQKKRRIRLFWDLSPGLSIAGRLLYLTELHRRPTFL